MPLLSSEKQQIARQLFLGIPFYGYDDRNAIIGSQFLAILQEKTLPVSLLRSKDTYLEILPQNADKADALHRLCASLHISPAQTIAIGDHDVDCALLRAAGVGVAMGNGSPAARQAADWIAPDNDHAGVAAAVYHWIREEQP